MSGGLATSLAGCTGSLPLIGDDGPEATVEAFFSAVEDDDREAANELIHPDGEVEEIGEMEWAIFQEAEVEGEVKDVEEDGDTATVTVETRSANDSEESTEESEWELRTHDGEWKIWDW